VTPPMTGAIEFYGGGENYPTIHHCYLYWKNYTISGAAAYGSLPPPFGRPCPFQSLARVNRVMGEASYVLKLFFMFQISLLVTVIAAARSIIVVISFIRIRFFFWFPTRFTLVGLAIIE
jgi:hypothetical protein